MPNELRLWVLAGALLVVGALVTAVPSSAKSNKTPVDFWQVNCLVDLGIDWVSDEGILHGRGRVEQVFFYAYDPETTAAEIIGVGVSVSNANIDLATGDGALSGTVSVTYLPVSAIETFYGRWHASLTGWGSVSGQGSSHGTGEARGVTIKLNFSGEPPPPWLEVELPTACPPDIPQLGILHNTGYVHKPHGG